MNAYESYHISFKPRSPLITPLQSDTLFGHVAWALRYLQGETDLLKFLDAFEEDTEAPFLISDGFPENHLPKPFFRALRMSTVENFMAKAAVVHEVDLKSERKTKIQKALKNQKYFALETVKKIQSNFTAETLLEASLNQINWKEIKNGKQAIGTAKKSETIVMYHNTVNRIYGQVLEGLYQQATQFYADDYKFDVYLKTNYFTEPVLKQIFDFIEHNGFGRDKSTGKGYFKIEVNKGDKLPSIPDANAFMVLSHYVPNANAPKKGFYRLMTKYGRLGGDFAKSVIPGIERYYGTAKPKVHPYKKPILMMCPGSVFRGKPELKYGVLLGGEHRDPELQVHKYPPIRHYAYAFPLGLKVNAKEFEL